jgi:hypothetical protein
LITAIALYPLLRIGAAVWGHEANPATLLYSSHAGYFWRSWTCAYAGAMVAVLAGSFLKDDARTFRVLGTGLSVAVTLLVAQSLFVP